MSKSAPRLNVELLEDRAVPSASATPQVNVSVTDIGQGVVPLGSRVTFTVDVSNSGPGAANDTTFIDTLPANLFNATWTSTTSTGVTGSRGSGIIPGNGRAASDFEEVLNLPADSSITYLFWGTLGAPPVLDLPSGSPVKQVTNTATAKVASFDHDTNPANNTATATDTTLGTLTGTPVDISVTTTPQSANTYTISIANNGTTAVNGIMVSTAGSGFALSTKWTSVESGGASGSAGSGTGQVWEPVNLPAGASITYTMTVPEVGVTTVSYSETNSLGTTKE